MDLFLGFIVTSVNWIENELILVQLHACRPISQRSLPSAYTPQVASVAEGMLHIVCPGTSYTDGTDHIYVSWGIDDD